MPKLKVLFINFTLFFIVSEVALFTKYWVQNGSPIPAFKLYTEQNNFYSKNQNSDCHWGAGVSLHPYLGTYYGVKDSCTRPDRNNYGFRGPDFPEQYDSNYYTILITGASVAEQIGTYLGPDKISMNRNDRQPFLEKILNQNWLSPNGKPFRILNASVAGFTQPSTSFAGIFFLNRVDHIISIEGFNEHWRLNTLTKLEAPSHQWKQLAFASESPIKYWLLSKVNLNITYIKNSIFKYSYLCYSLISLINNYLTEDFNKFSSDNQIFTNYNIKTAKQDEINQDILNSYTRNLKYTNYLAKSENKKYTLFIQPSALLYKNLTEDEKKSIGQLPKAGAEKFATLTQHLYQLNKQLDAETLVKVFEPHDTTTLYIDLVHTNSQGVEILSNKISDTLAARYKWKKRN